MFGVVEMCERYLSLFCEFFGLNYVDCLVGVSLLFSRRFDLLDGCIFVWFFFL